MEALCRGKGTGNSLCGRPSVFLAGTSGLDSDIAIAKMADTARTLDTLGDQGDDG